MNARTPDKARLFSDLVHHLLVISEERPGTDMPDLHLYVDLSGSTTSTAHKQAVMVAWDVALTFGIRLFVNFFTHELSEEARLATDQETPEAFWADFESAITLAPGGTDYAAIWRYVAGDQERASRLSVVLTDFEWMPPKGDHTHPEHVFYAPSAGGADLIRRSADHFVASMQHIEPEIESRLIGMVA